MEDLTSRPAHMAYYFSLAVFNREFAFREISGLHTELEVETIQEGGVNEYEHKLPKQMRHENLVCKRAIVPLNTRLTIWIKSVLEYDFTKPVERNDLKIFLLGADGKPLYIWTCEKAFPVKWNVDPFHSEKNEIAIESLEFAYTTLKRSRK
ncbi:MAG: phage tail protein [Bacteroides sp.]|nr:phage tail protein [Bacteroides sp.]